MKSIHSASLVAAAALLGTGATAQSGISVSPSMVMTSRAMPAAGGTAQGPDRILHATVGLASEAGPASAAGQTLRAGLAADDATLGPTPPIVLAVSPDAGPKQGGDVLSVIGLGFAAGGTPALDFGGSSAAVSVVSGIQLVAVAPPGMNALLDLAQNPIEGNPLGAVGVGIGSALGSSVAPAAFTYLPALIQTSEAHLLQALGIRFRSTPGSLSLMSAGFITPGIGIPIPGFEGALELLFGHVSIDGIVTADTDGIYDYAVAIPNKPALIGKKVWFQTLSVESLAPVTGGFTNVLTVVIQP